MLALAHYRFAQLLTFKMDRVGCRVIRCEEHFTSKTCSRCGVVKSGLGAAAVFKCSDCGLSVDRDVNGAANIYHKNFVLLRGDGKIPAIEALALDLDGQVFVKYSSVDSTDAAAGVVGIIKVFGSAESLTDSVSIKSKRAMKGAKLAISRSSSPIEPATTTTAMTTDSSEFLVTEVVLLRKTALKKVIANGVADVVISDDVLFTKKPTSSANEERRALQSVSDSSGGISTQQVERDAASVFASKSLQLSRTWTILTSTNDKSAHGLDIRASGQGSLSVNRIDSDLLPEGSIGTVEVVRGEIEVTTSAASRQDVLLIDQKNDNTSNSSTLEETRMHVIVNLSPNVDVMDLTTVQSADGGNLRVTKNLDKTFPDDSVTLFVNGTGDLFVLANKSIVNVTAFSIRVAGNSRVQVQIAKIHSTAGIRTSRDYHSEGILFSSPQTLVMEGTKTCEWTAASFTMMGGADNEEGKSRCSITEVRKWIGASKERESTPPPTSNAVHDTSLPCRGVVLAVLAAISVAVV